MFRQVHELPQVPAPDHRTGLPRALRTLQGQPNPRALISLVPALAHASDGHAGAERGGVGGRGSRAGIQNHRCDTCSEQVWLKPTSELSFLYGNHITKVRATLACNKCQAPRSQDERSRICAGVSPAPFPAGRRVGGGRRRVVLSCAAGRCGRFCRLGWVESQRTPRNTRASLSTTWQTSHSVRPARCPPAARCVCGVVLPLVPRFWTPNPLYSALELLFPGSVNMSMSVNTPCCPTPTPEASCRKMPRPPPRAVGLSCF